MFHTTSANSSGFLEGIRLFVSRTITSIPRLPLFLVVYVAIIGYIYKRMMRDFLGVGTKRVRILGKVALDLTKEEEVLAASVVDPAAITDTFDDVGGLVEAKETLTESVIWPYEHPEIFERGGYGDTALPSGVLLHGPPGTGKTLLARALAKQLGCFFMNVSPEMLFSKYVGESEKLAAAIFSLAHKLNNCVIFVDEIDSLLAQRNESSDTAVFNHTKTIFMTKWDGLTTHDRTPGAQRHRILVLGATNRPQALDEAIIRRLPVRLFVPFPDQAARRQILEIHFRALGLEAATNQRPDVLDCVARRTENYSGSDLKELCKAALAVSVRGAIQAIRATAATGNGGRAAEGTVEPRKERALITLEHFDQAFKRVRSSAVPESEEANPTRDLLRALAATGRNRR